jgi:2-hydroxychromene-2-carboxylate isomerase
MPDDMPRPIDFYFDFSSPYGYLASTRIDDLAARHGREVAWRPFLLGAAFKLTGQRALVEQPLRGPYAQRDFLRSARLLGIPFRLPERFPFFGLAASRACYWIEDAAKSRALAKAVYHAAFGEGRDVTPVAVVDELARGLGVSGVEQGIELPGTKSRLREATDQALAKGVFGSPFFIVDGEPFWGHDRLDQLERWLETGGW